MKLSLVMIATFALLLGAKASALATSPVATATKPVATSVKAIEVAIHCSDCDAAGQDYEQAVEAAMAQHPEYHVVNETAARANTVRIEISSHTEAAGGSEITVVSRHAGSFSTQTVERSCNKIGIDDVARGTVDNLPEIL